VPQSLPAPTDLTAAFRRAHAAKWDWNLDTMRWYLRDFAQVWPEGHADYETGERWGRVVAGDETGVMACRLLPLAFVRSDLAGRAPEEGVVVIEFGSWTDAAYAVDRRILDEVFGEWRDEEANPQRFSLNDLYWATL
jgi:hypothetical protein